MKKSWEDEFDNELNDEDYDDEDYGDEDDDEEEDYSDEDDDEEDYDDDDEDDDDGYSEYDAPRSTRQSHNLSSSYDAGVNQHYQKAKKPKKKKTKVFKLSVVFVPIFIIVFLHGLRLALNGEDEHGNFILFISGVIELVMFFIIALIDEHRAKYLCPECGHKREHHRSLQRTTERVKTGAMGTVTTYTHHYIDTYECPNCGTTYSVNYEQSGGELDERNNGQIFDRRKSPREF